MPQSFDNDALLFILFPVLKLGKYLKFCGICSPVAWFLYKMVSQISLRTDEAL